MWFCFFFFSSRRRHTRLTCDWSSDVCSSDLMPSVKIDDSFYQLGFLDTWHSFVAPLEFSARESVAGLQKRSRRSGSAMLRAGSRCGRYRHTYDSTAAAPGNKPNHSQEKRLGARQISLRAPP